MNTPLPFRILSLIEHDSWSYPDIARKINRNSRSTYKLMTKLENCGLVQKTGRKYRYTNDWQYLYDNLDKVDTTNAVKLLAVIKYHPGITVTEIRKKVFPNMTWRAVKEHVTILRNTGLVDYEQSDSHLGHYKYYLRKGFLQHTYIRHYGMKHLHM